MGSRKSLGRNIWMQGEKSQGYDVEGMRGPVSCSLEGGWVHKRPVGYPLDANGHWDMTLVRNAKKKVSWCGLENNCSEA